MDSVPVSIPNSSVASLILYLIRCPTDAIKNRARVAQASVLGLSLSRLENSLHYLQPDGIFRSRRRRCLARQRRPDNPAVLVELHAQAEAHLGQYILDLVE